MELPPAWRDERGDRGGFWERPQHVYLQPLRWDAVAAVTMATARCIVTTCSTKPERWCWRGTTIQRRAAPVDGVKYLAKQHGTVVVTHARTDTGDVVVGTEPRSIQTAYALLAHYQIGVPCAPFTVQKLKY